MCPQLDFYNVVCTVEQFHPSLTIAYLVVSQTVINPLQNWYKCVLVSCNVNVVLDFTNNATVICNKAFYTFDVFSGVNTTPHTSQCGDSS